MKYVNMKIKLLKEIKEWLLSHPSKYNQDTWVNSKGIDKKRFEGDYTGEACGTACCIGGAAIVISGKYGTWDKVARDIYDARIRAYDTASKLLGLDQYQSHRLFYKDAWPVEFFRAYVDAKGPKERAEVAARRIDHFIDTKGKE